MLGRPVVQELHQRGFQVTAFVRNPKKAAKCLPEGVDMIRGDLKNVGSIVSALQGHDAIYLSLSIEPTEKEKAFHTETDGLRNILQAVQIFPVKRIGYLSSIIHHYETDWWVFQVKRDAVQIIRESGIPADIYYPSNFMESIIHKYMAANLLLIAKGEKYPQYWIAAADYARQVAKAFRISHAGVKEYAVQGPEALGQEEALERFRKAYKGKPLWIAKTGIGTLEVMGRFSRQLDYGYNLLNAINNYKEEFQAQNTWEILGKPEMTIEDFAKSLR